ncbi:fibrillin-1, partial [Biomphalaria glabrata]
CSPFTYGRDACNLTCNCNQTNTEYCVSLTGECKCNPNWTSLDCNKISDRCHYWSCMSNEVCVNYLGGYRCDCQQGYVRTENGMCENHCQNPNICPDPYGVCVSEYVGQRCECKDGLVKSSNSQCQ